MLSKWCVLAESDTKTQISVSCTFIMPFESSCSWTSNCCLFDLDPFIIFFIEVLFCFKTRERKLVLNFRAFLYQHALQLSAPVGNLVGAGNVFGQGSSTVSAVRLAPAWPVQGPGSLRVSMGQGLFPESTFRADTCFNGINVVLWQLTSALGSVLGYVSYNI